MYLIKTMCFFASLALINEDEKSKNLKMSNDVLFLVNKIRQEGCKCGNDFYPSVPKLEWNKNLETAAFNHSLNMHELNFFSHQDTFGKNVIDRVEAVGYNWIVLAENIAKNQQSAISVVESWINSEGHCKNIMNPEYDHMAVAKFGDFWTQIFASKHP